MAEDTDPTTIADIRESALGGKGIGARSPCSATESRASKLLKHSITVAWFVTTLSEGTYSFPPPQQN